jgi:hypothetical protein
MELSINELVELQNRNQQGLKDAYNKGVQDERERALPDNLFEALLKYGKDSKTLVEYSRSSGPSDGCNWIQLKPTRSGSEGVKSVEISFDENLTEIHSIGINPENELL